jgi:hypothetical protein
MIINDRIDINISYRNITHYIKLGYNPVIGEYLNIETKHLPSSSHVRVEASCDLCMSETSIIYHKYLLNISRYGFYGCKKCSRQKAAITSIKKYGVDNYSKTSEFKIRVSETNLKNCGFKTNLLSPKHKEITRKILIDRYGKENWYEIRNGKRSKIEKFQLTAIERNYKVEFSENLYDDSLILNEYLLYRNECRKLTSRNIKDLIGGWNGVDYYDGENIIDNYNLDHNDPNYPTIDHKISIYFGFINKINPKDISRLEIK